MKFWDTIAKMCGVEIKSDLATRGYWVGKVCVGPFAIPLGWSVDDAKISFGIYGHGIGLRDSTRCAKQTKRGFHIGLIDIERIRPMKGKSAEVQPLREAAEALAKEANGISIGRDGKATVLS